jgi:hypothetical protein
MSCIFNNNSRWKPDVYDSIPRLQNTIHGPLGPLGPNNKRNAQTNHIVTGGAGFFGEIRGPCGWKEEKKYDCCFKKCKPLWKTRLWPFKISL